MSTFTQCMVAAAAIAVVWSFMLYAVSRREKRRTGDWCVHFNMPCRHDNVCREVCENERYLKEKRNGIPPV